MAKTKEDYLLAPTEYFEANTLLPPFWVISDTHWFHNNIVKYCGRDKQLEALIGPDRAKRYDHNSYMVECWNETVRPNDVVLHLGDLFMSKHENYQKFEHRIAPKLNGKKYLILGNHDDKKLDYKKLGFTPIKPFRIRYGDYTVEFSHYPSGPAPGYVRSKLIRVHGHIHNNGYSRDKPIMYRKANVNCSVEVIDYTPQPVTAMLDAEIKRLA